MKKVFLICSFIFAFFLFSNAVVEAKVSEGEVFKVTVGDTSLPLYYSLVQNNVVFNSNDEEVGNLESGVISMNDGKTYILSGNKIIDENNEEVGVLSGSTITMSDNTVYTLGSVEIKERIQFNVYITGLSEIKNSYKWEHKLCYKVSGNGEICEMDITGDSDSNNQISSNGEYSYYFYDGHMPYYSETLEFEYITFKNKFVCIDCESNQEYTLDDITFNKEEINYKYSYGIDVDYVLNDGKKYVFAYSSSNQVYVQALFMNNSGSNLILVDSPTYKLVNEVCVEENCVVQEIDKVYSSGNTNGEAYDITPYLGNLSFYYGGENLMWVDKEIEYEFATYITKLVCLTNCDSRRVEDIVVVSEEDYYFDYTAPVVDEENTEIDSYESVEYIKNSEIKITVNDSQSGIDSSRLKYYIVRPYSSYCSIGSEISYSFANGESFQVGSGLNGGYCIYYVAYDKNGNYYKSDYYVYYFDNNGPTMSFSSNYDSSKYYNNVVVNPLFSDNYSGLKNVYYVWSKEVIGEENYLIVKENGVLYEDSISSLNDINEDGTYYLYFLAYDNLDNYKFYDLGSFNIDTTGLSVNDISVVFSGFGDSYSNLGTIKVSVSEMSDDEEFECGFFIGESVEISDLTSKCYNNQIMNIPNGFEGNYDFFVNIHDRANNYSVLKILEDLKVDTSAPKIDVNMLYNDDNYHIVNEITVSVSDLSGVNSSSLKYGWFLTSKNNVLKSDLNNTYVSDESFGYPVSYYGEYNLYVVAIDNLGNEIFKKIDKVFKIDTDIIRISLIGEESVTVLKGQEYEELGARAYKGDVISGGRVSDVRVSGNVDTSRAGTYYVTYSSGEGALLVSVTRKIVVKNDFGYIVIGGSLFVVSLLVTSLRLFIRRKKD